MLLLFQDGAKKMLYAITGIQTSEDFSNTSASTMVQMARSAKILRAYRDNEEGLPFGLMMNAIGFQVIREQGSAIEGKVDHLITLQATTTKALPAEASSPTSTFDASLVVDAHMDFMKGGFSARENENMVQRPLHFLAGTPLEALNKMMILFSNAVPGANSLSQFGLNRNVGNISVHGRSWDAYSNIRTSGGMGSQLFKMYKEMLVKQVRGAVTELVGPIGKPVGGEHTQASLQVFTE